MKTPGSLTTGTGQAYTLFPDSDQVSVRKLVNVCQGIDGATGDLCPGDTPIGCLDDDTAAEAEITC